MRSLYQSNVSWDLYLDALYLDYWSRYSKVLLFVFKTMNGLTPPYLSDVLSVYAPRKALLRASVLGCPSVSIQKNGAIVLLPCMASGSGTPYHQSYGP